MEGRQMSNEAWEKFITSKKFYNAGDRNGWLGVAEKAWQAATAQSAQSIQELEAEIHNLKWALGAEGYEKMATPEQQAECDAHHEKIMNRIKGMKERKDIVLQLKSDNESLVKINNQQANEIVALQAHIEELRKALEVCKLELEMQGCNESYADENSQLTYDIAKQALASAPQQSLQNVIDETIERCAKVCEKVDETTAECPELAIYCAEAIRALKGEQNKP